MSSTHHHRLARRVDASLDRLLALRSQNTSSQLCAARPYTLASYIERLIEELVTRREVYATDAAVDPLFRDALWPLWGVHDHVPNVGTPSIHVKSLNEASSNADLISEAVTLMDDTYAPLANGDADFQMFLTASRQSLNALLDAIG